MDNKKTMVVFILCLLLISVCLAGCIVPTKYMAEMRDGIHLATDVYLKKGTNLPHGAILIRTPYNKNPLSLIGMTWAKKGWPTIIQDVRGRFASEGIDTVFRNAHTDGPDTLSWIANQTWSNGKVATFGGSALGIVQYFMAGANPPNLACQFVQVATPNFHKHAVYQGGQFRKQLVEKWLERQGSIYVLPELFEHENYTLEFWTNVSLEDNWQDVNVPAIHIGGWYDIFVQGTIDGYMGYQYLGGVGAQGKSKLIIGPWTHGGAKSTKQGQLTYPENCIDTFSENLFWQMVGQYAMNEPSNYDQWPAVYYYVMGDVDDNIAPGNEWREAEDWPIPSTSREWFFHENGTLITDPPMDYGYSLTYTYDPADPVETVGGQNLNLPPGPYDQSEVESRDDVLVFTSPVLEEPYEATGPVKARLYLSSDCPDTDFTVKLTDVYPDGRSMLITDGILRMRNRNGTDHWELMEQGEIYEVEVDLWSTSYVWNTGHKIRVAISSSNYPRFLNNPNTADGIYGNTTYNVAQNTLYLDGIHLSCIILPEVEPGGGASTPPNKPDVPSGPASGKAKTEYVHSSTTTDLDGDKVSLLFDWGDGTFSGWIGPYESGEDVEASHIWKEKGTYEIRIKAKDIGGTQSEWSDILEVSIPRERKLSKADTVQLVKKLVDRYPFSKKIFSLPTFERIFDFKVTGLIPFDP